MNLIHFVIQWIHVLHISDRFKRISKIIGDMYGTDLVNAKRVLATKMNKSQPNPENLTLAERILINRKRGGEVGRTYVALVFCSEANREQNLQAVF